MRMNDLHDVTNEKSYMHSTFWLQHRDYWRVPNSSSGSWTERALDYGVPEVREHAMAFIGELLERYDPDGIELDWMRFGWHFKPGQADQGSAILTEFMRAARHLNIGPRPMTGRATFIVGFAERSGLDEATFVVTVNGVACTVAANRTNPGQAPVAASNLQFECPRDAVKEGYNKVHIKQQTGAVGQQIIWAEIRVAPE
jgi:hypothetical protein